MFQKHPDVGVCHIDQTIELWEPNFWNFALEAIRGRPRAFIERFGRSHPFLGGGAPATEEDAFAMWDAVLDRLGPIVFDKSPRYLGDRDAVELLMKYAARGNDVRFIGLVRDPRDVISSQFSLWGHLSPGDTPQAREERWVDQYEHLDALRAKFHIPVFRYEDLAATPGCYAPMILHHCGLADHPKLYRHIKPVNVGRHLQNAAPELRSWVPGHRFRWALERYGYLPDRARSGAAPGRAAPVAAA
jgi:hypothetical protein